MTDTAPALYGPEFEADPHPAYRWLREHDPVHRVDLPGGAWAWLVTRYGDAREVLADPNMLKDPARGEETWHKAGLGLPFDHRPTLVRSMVNVDAPDHTRLRKVVSGAFTPGGSERSRSARSGSPTSSWRRWSGPRPRTWCAIWPTRCPSRSSATSSGCPRRTGPSSTGRRR